jgi:hypothetical protein
MQLNLILHKTLCWTVTYLFTSNAVSFHVLQAYVCGRCSINLSNGRYHVTAFDAEECRNVKLGASFFLVTVHRHNNKTSYIAKRTI